MQHAFTLPETTECECSQVVIGTENHGDEKVRAVHLFFWKDGPNDLLDLFRPGLRKDVYCNRAAEAGQTDLDPELAILPNLRIPDAQETLRIGGDTKHGGYRLIADYGLGDDAANVDLTDSVVAKKWIEPKEGGTVRIGWRVSYAGEALNDVMTRGVLAGLKGQKAFIQLHAPAVLQVIKGGKGSKPAKVSGAAGDDNQGSVLDDDQQQDADTPEKALERAAAGG